MCFLISKIRTFIFLSLLICFSTQASAQGDKLQSCLDKAVNPLAQMECFRGLPYRVDGALDEYGNWTTWANQDQNFTSAGLNCSGLTHAISRTIFEQNLSLNDAKRDRLNDSGPDSVMGEDWDFGLDLILNLTDGLPRQLIPNPYENQGIDSHLWSAADLRGVSVDSIEFVDMLEQLQPDKLYYFAISKSDKKFKGGISFYHVGFFIKDGENIWMYHATPKGGVYRMNLAEEGGLAQFKRYYGVPTKGAKHIQLIEVSLDAAVADSI